MRSVVVNIARLVVAVTFILSGFVKAVDPMGTQYKIADYLEAMHLGALSTGFLTLVMALLLSAAEFGLGICLLFAIRRRVVSRIILVVMVGMTLLSLWLVVSNPVSDCGCFGDALVLTNWQTFGKNIILLGCALILSRWPTDMLRFVSRSNQWIVVNFTALFILALSAWSLYDLPPFDFRPYHVGANIKQGMEIPEGAEPPRFETTYVMEKGNEQRVFGVDNYPDSTWTLIEANTRQVSAGYVPPIHDFFITRISDGEDLTDSLLSLKGYLFLLVSPHLEDADDSHLDLINQLCEYAQEEGYPFYGLTASGEEAITFWRDMTGADYDFFQSDETTLKTIIRSNPGVLLLKDGTVIRKWSHNRLPDEEALDGRLEDIGTGTMPKDSVPRKVVIILLWYVLPLVLLTTADRLWAWSQWVKRKEQSNKVYQFLKKKQDEKKNRSRQLEDEPEPAGGPESGQGTE